MKCRVCEILVVLLWLLIAGKSTRARPCRIGSDGLVRVSGFRCKVFSGKQQRSFDFNFLIQKEKTPIYLVESGSFHQSCLSWSTN